MTKDIGTPSRATGLTRSAAVLTLSMALALPAAAWSDPPIETSNAAPSWTAPRRTATLHHDSQFILQMVATRMGVTLRPGIPEPKVLLESQTPLSRLQAAAEQQWGFRPHVFLSAFASARNEIFLIDDAATYERRGGTLDDALAHELVHYLQANYRKALLQTDWAELEAVAIQAWFRAEYMEPKLIAVDARPSRAFASD